MPGAAGGDPGQRLPVLIIVHQERSTPGRIGRWLRERGYPLDIRRPRFGAELPKTLERHSGAIIFGGPMSANDPEPYMIRETDWIGVALGERKPFLGVCLGAQMLARHLGGQVSTHPDHRVEIGYYPIEASPIGRALGRWPAAFYQWHREGFDLPVGAVDLATGSHYERQAFQYGPSAVGVQFHPEITYGLINRWTSGRPDRLILTGAQARKEHFEGYFAHHQAVGRWLDWFLERWLRSDLAPVIHHPGQRPQSAVSLGQPAGCFNEA